MKKLLILSGACVLSVGQVLAQTPAAAPAPAPAPAPTPAPTIVAPPTPEEVRAPRPLRARGITTELAIEAAQTAIATCLANSYKVTGLIVDAAGVPIVMISGDGAAAITQRVAMGKAITVIRFNMNSGDAAARARTDAAY